MQLGRDGPGWGTKLGSQLHIIPHVNDTLSLPAPYKSHSNREGMSVSQQLLGGAGVSAKGHLHASQLLISRVRCGDGRQLGMERAPRQ